MSYHDGAGAVPPPLRGVGSFDVTASPTRAATKKSSKLCLGVVGAKGADIVLFDASGTPRTFSHKGDTRKLCFSTHGIGADIFTHCFDEDGIHGTPEEPCYCGLDTPHLHAHVYDPKRCGNNSSGDHFNNNNNASYHGPDHSSDDFATLGLVTLHPVEPLLEENGEYKQLVRIPISAELPNQCNSSEMSRHMMAHGIEPTDQVLRRRIHQIQHDDHVDYLVHDSSTGHLHLEHPNCNTCGQNDVHGLFKCVGKRRWEDATGNRDVQVHFFETSPRPFSIIEFIHDLFDPNSSRRVMYARPDPTQNMETMYCTFLPEEPKKTSHHSHPHNHQQYKRANWQYAAPEPPDTDGAVELVRSTFMCTQICCSSEVPMIRSVLDPVDGIERILVNVPLKQVLVDHDPSIITATGIETILNKERFGASIKMDGGASALASNNSKGRSHFLVQHICCASEIPAINKIVQPIPGVSNVSISVPTKMVYVDHDTIIVSAQQICDALNAHQFGATLKLDAKKEMTSLASVICTSTLSSIGDAPLNQVSAENALAKFDSAILESFSVDVADGTIVVVHNPIELSVATIIAALEAGSNDKYKVVLDGAAGHAGTDEVNDSESPKLPNIYVLLSGFFLAISLFSYIGHDWDYLKFVATLSIACGLPPIALKAFHTLQRYQFDTNCLMLFAILGAVALEEFVEGGAVTFLFGISEWLELRATSRARTALSTIVSLRPEYANLVHPSTNVIIVVPASSVPIGALVSVKPGDKVPCDGLVVEGTSTVDESSLTGESRPIRKAPDDEVAGGTINSGFTQLVVRTTSTADNSAVAKLIRLVEEAQANRSETEKIVEEFARFYTPVIVLGALIMCSVPWIYGRAEGKRWSHNGLVLMVVACPCALIISTPVAYVAGLAASAQRGILIKGGAHLESLGLVKNIAFDKTGTLTQGQFALLHLDVVGTKRSRKEVLEMLSLMEERASHPLSQAILTAARNEGVTVPKHLTVLNHTFLAGEGVQGIVNGAEVYVGNERLFRRLGLFDSLAESIKETCQLWASTGGTVGFMSVEGDGIVCIYSVADAVRPEAKEVVASLQRMGITLSMLTGDNSDTALAIGEQIGLSESEIRSRLLPEEKLSIVTSMKGEKSARSVVSNPLSKPCLVLMCGDGVNDAPALAVADVSVAMGAGAALAMDTSDVTLLDSDLRKLVYSIRMGRRVIRKIKENIVFSVVVKVIVVGFALAGKTRLWAAISSDVGAMILVTLNGMSLLPRQKKSKGADHPSSSNGGHGDSDVEASQADVHGGFNSGIRTAGQYKDVPRSSTVDNCCSGRQDSVKHQLCGGRCGDDDINASDCHGGASCGMPNGQTKSCASGRSSGCCDADGAIACDDSGCCDKQLCGLKQACQAGSRDGSCCEHDTLEPSSHHEHHSHDHSGIGHHSCCGSEYNGNGHLGGDHHIRQQKQCSEHNNHSHEHQCGGHRSEEHHNDEHHSHEHQCGGHQSDEHHANEHNNHEHQSGGHRSDDHHGDENHNHEHQCGGHRSEEHHGDEHHDHEHQCGGHRGEEQNGHEHHDHGHRGGGHHNEEHHDDEHHSHEHQCGGHRSEEHHNDEPHSHEHHDDERHNHDLHLDHHHGDSSHGCQHHHT